MTNTRPGPNLLAIFHHFLCLLWFAGLCSASCYWPDGTDVNAYWNVSDLYYYQPCHNDTASNATAASMCCATGPGRVADGNADECIEPHGLCFSEALGLYWRESCTDQTWQDPACLKLFVNGTNSGKDVALTACPKDGSWCADNVGGSQGCCAAGNGFFITRDGTVTQHNGSAVSSASTSSSGAPTFAPSDSSSSSATSTTSASSGSSSSSTTSAASAPNATSTQNPGPSGLSTGAKAGIGVGAALGALALLAGAYFVVRKSRRKPEPPTTGSTIKGHEMYSPPPPVEMHGTPAYAEMDPQQKGAHKNFGTSFGVGTPAAPAQLE